jgi:N-acetylneuraminate synthase
MAEFKIAHRIIGDNHPPVVIAEIGINHGGCIDVAIAMVDAAINVGAEIIKHQTHILEDEMSIEARNIIPANANESIYEIMEHCALSEFDEQKLMDYVKSRGAIFISTPFSRAAVDRLIKFDIPAFKIGSGECNNYPLVNYIASFGKPVIMSTGMNSINTIKPSVEILRRANVSFALLHCTNVYPTPPEIVRLGAIKSLKDTFPDAVIGLSDHTTSNFTSFGAVALGASILERHFTDRMDRSGPDIICSMDPRALAELIKGANIIFSARGNDKNPVPDELPTIAFAFASVVAIADINPGDILSERNIWVMRPGGGDFSALEYSALLGKSAKSHIKRGYQLKKLDINNEV